MEFLGITVGVVFILIVIAALIAIVRGVHTIAAPARDADRCAGVPNAIHRRRRLA